MASVDPMKPIQTYLCKLIAFFTLTIAVWAQAELSLEDQLTALWKERKYAELGKVLDAKASGKTPDIVALYCSKFFYVFVQPDKSKALAAVNRLKKVAEATASPDFILFANGEVAEVQSIPDAEFVQPTGEILTLFHNEFGESYPNVEMGRRLKKFIAH